MAVSFIGEETGGPGENHQYCTPRPDRDSNSQHQ